jgi:tetratricopeptide (TPR) repeat protein
LRAVKVLLLLAPGCVGAYDRAAALHYRAGDVERALRVLETWHELAPADPLPLVRRAALAQRRGDAGTSQGAIQKALALTSGPARASVAFLGARLALAAGIPRDGTGDWDGVGVGIGRVRQLLLECLREQPDHAEALWTLAAVRSATGDLEGLAAQAPAMNRPDVQDARFHYLAAVCHLAARAYPQAVEAARRAASDSSLAVESQFVLAWACLHQGDEESAAGALEAVAAAGGPSADHACGLLGRLSFQRGAYSDAIRWWSAVDAGKRAEWKCDEPLRQMVLLAGLLAFGEGKHEQAAERFREAGKLGLRDRRLGPLIGLSLFRAGQRLLFQE